MTFGREGTEQARVHTIEDALQFSTFFQAHGHNEIDTARFYGEGSSESFLGDLDCRKRGIVMDTKTIPQLVGKCRRAMLQKKAGDIPPSI